VLYLNYTYAMWRKHRKTTQSTTSQNYQLRQRVPDRQFTVHLGHLIDKNFITRSLYKDMY